MHPGAAGHRAPEAGLPPSPPERTSTIDSSSPFFAAAAAAAQRSLTTPSSASQQQHELDRLLQTLTPRDAASLVAVLHAVQQQQQKQQQTQQTHQQQPPRAPVLEQRARSGSGAFGLLSSSGLGSDTAAALMGGSLGSSTLPFNLSALLTSNSSGSGMMAAAAGGGGAAGQTGLVESTWRLRDQASLQSAGLQHIVKQMSEQQQRNQQQQPAMLPRSNTIRGRKRSSGQDAAGLAAQWPPAGTSAAAGAGGARLPVLAGVPVPPPTSVLLPGALPSSVTQQLRVLQPAGASDAAHNIAKAAAVAAAAAAAEATPPASPTNLEVAAAGASAARETAAGAAQLAQAPVSQEQQQQQPRQLSPPAAMGSVQWGVRRDAKARAAAKAGAQDPGQAVTAQPEASLQRRRPPKRSLTADVLMPASASHKQQQMAELGAPDTAVADAAEAAAAEATAAANAAAAAASTGATLSSLLGVSPALSGLWRQQQLQQAAYGSCPDLGMLAAAVSGKGELQALSLSALQDGGSADGADTKAAAAAAGDNVCLVFDQGALGGHRSKCSKGGGPTGAELGRPAAAAAGSSGASPHSPKGWWSSSSNAGASLPFAQHQQQQAQEQGVPGSSQRLSDQGSPGLVTEPSLGYLQQQWSQQQWPQPQLQHSHHQQHAAGGRRGGAARGSAASKQQQQEEMDWTPAAEAAGPATTTTKRPPRSGASKSSRAVREHQGQQEHAHAAAAGGAGADAAAVVEGLFGLELLSEVACKQLQAQGWGYGMGGFEQEPAAGIPVAPAVGSAAGAAPAFGLACSNQQQGGSSLRAAEEAAARPTPPPPVQGLPVSFQELAPGLPVTAFGDVSMPAPLPQLPAMRAAAAPGGKGTAAGAAGGDAGVAAVSPSTPPTPGSAGPGASPGLAAAATLNSSLASRAQAEAAAAAAATVAAAVTAGPADLMLGNSTTALLSAVVSPLDTTSRACLAAVLQLLTLQGVIEWHDPPLQRPCGPPPELTALLQAFMAQAAAQHGVAPPPTAAAAHQTPPRQQQQQHQQQHGARRQ